MLNEGPDSRIFHGDERLQMGALPWSHESCCLGRRVTAGHSWTCLVHYLVTDANQDMVGNGCQHMWTGCVQKPWEWVQCHHNRLTTKACVTNNFNPIGTSILVSMILDLLNWYKDVSPLCYLLSTKLRLLLIETKHSNSFAEDCSNSIANVLELLQPCIKPLIYVTVNWVIIGSGNDLLPEGSKPSPEPILEYCQFDL